MTDREMVFELRSIYRSYFDDLANLKDTIKTAIGSSAYNKFKKLVGK